MVLIAFKQNFYTSVKTILLCYRYFSFWKSLAKCWCCLFENFDCRMFSGSDFNEKYKIFSKSVSWLLLTLCVLVAQSCPTLCDPMDYSPPDSSVHGILQARILEWAAVSFSRGSSRPRDQCCVSYVSFIGRWILYHWITREAQVNFCHSSFAFALSSAGMLALPLRVLTQHLSSQ